ncbi:MAG: AMP-binding protein [Crocinitomicaceae bacterium]
MSIKIIFLESVPEIERKAVDSFLKLWNSDAKTITISTSGSTGIPKKIRLTKLAMVQSAKATGHFFNFKPNQKNLLAVSAVYIAGMMQIVRSIVFDLTLYVAPLNSNPLKELKLPKLDFAAFVPLQVEAILKNNSSKLSYEGISNVIIGGAPIHSELNSKIESLSNHSFATFGMTETISHIALREIKNGNDVYQAMPNVSFSNNDEDCLQINAFRISDHLIVTNDRVEILNDHAFKWIGRSDFTINSGGIKIQPELVEKKLNEILTNPYYISGLPDTKLGDKVVLYIESEEYNTEKLKQLTRAMENELDIYEIPKTVIFKSRFNRTSTGKIIRE